MNTPDNQNKGSTLLLVGMLAVIALGVAGALLYNQQLHVYENRAKERVTTQQQQLRMNNQGKGSEGTRELNTDDVLPPDPDDPTAMKLSTMPSTEKPGDFKTNDTGVVRTDL